MIPINFGQRIERRIEPAIENEYYTFEAEAGDLIWLTMSESLKTNRFFNPYIRLYNPDGTLVGSDDGIYTAYLTDIELVQDGTYTIVTGDYYVDDTGDYSLYLQRINNPINAIPISFAERIEDGIDFENEWDTYTFEAEAGDLIWLTMSESLKTNRFFNPYIRLYNPDGTLVGSDDGIYTAYLTDIELVQDGTYTIIAGDYYVDDTRDYSLYLQRLNNPANAIPISFGEIIEDRIDFENEWDTYTFEAEAGDLIWLTMSENSNTNRFFNPYIRLYNPDGTLVGSDNGIYNADLTDIELVQDGTYTIIAGDYYVDDVRDYSLYLQRLNNLRIDPLLGNDSNDFLDEGIGNYRLNGIGDNDSLLNNYTTDPLTASGKQDLIYSETDNYSLFGNDNIDIL